LTFAAAVLFSGTGESIDTHVIWERDFPRLSANSATTDAEGNLWIASSYRGSDRLVRISSRGEITADVPVPESMKPQPPADMFSVELATSATGAVALLTRYSHGGKVIYFDGAKFALMSPEGTLTSIQNVAGEGPDYKGFVPLSDGHFLVLGDQSPMVVINLKPDGSIAWRRTFPHNWVLPSAAAIDAGSTCIISPDYNRQILRLIWMNMAGDTVHRTEFPGHRSEAASLGSDCTILHSRSSGQYRVEYLLSSFDSTLKRKWSVSVAGSAPGGEYKVAAVAGGYMVAIQGSEGLLLAKYSTSGQPLWSVADATRMPAHRLIRSGDGFYIIGAGLKHRYDLHVIRGQ
jgi:hypothetical protein